VSKEKLEVLIHCAYDELADITTLVPNPRNPNRHPDKQIELLAKIIKNQGWRAPITVSTRSGFIVRGPGRLLAAQKLGSKEVPVDRQDYASEAEEWADLIADNRIAELSEIDDEAVSQLLAEFDIDFDRELTGYNLKEVDKLIAEFDLKEVAEDNFDVDQAVADIKEPVTKPGDIIQLGRHRLMCGDATKLVDVQKLMDGKLASMVFTDPPYNVNYTGGTGDKLKIQNDNMPAEEFNAFLQAAFAAMYAVTDSGGAIYVCHADTESGNFRGALQTAGWGLKQCLIWVKNQFVIGRQDYQWRHEPILYGWKPGASHRWYGGRKQSTVIEDLAPVTVKQVEDGAELTFNTGLNSVTIKVPAFEILNDGAEERSSIWHFDKPLRNTEHPTMKPISLCARAIQNSSKQEEIVLDLFGGSGSTLMAAEQIGRSCYMMELDPKYCDVIVRRWEGFTGQTTE
jgi:DNA modification methylase